MKDYCVITAYFNLDNNPYRLRNYKIFHEKLKEQGVPLICAEASFSGSFELREGDADILIQKKTNTYLWHKEALLNLCLDALPKQVKYVFWMDGDVYFRDSKWINKSIQALQQYDFIQPFENAIYLSKQGNIQRKTKSAGFLGKKISKGFSGYAWGTKREIIDNIRFYDKAIFGSYDYLFLSRFQKKSLDFVSKKLKEDFIAWSLERNISEYSFGYAKNDIYHLWHSEDKNRLRKFRHKIEEYFNYTPWKDIRKINGLYSWNTQKTLFHTLAKDYLLFRSNPTLSRKTRLALFWLLVVKNIFIKPKKYLELRTKEEIPKKPKKLPGSFWGITTFYNSSGQKIKYENYKIFRKNLQKQHLPLLTVELAFENKPFELKEHDAELLIQIRGNKKNIMWQKEALLNIGLKNLPKNCDKIAWLDCDIIFKNKDWVSETAALLEQYVVVQPFETVVRLKKNQSNVSSKKISQLKYGIDNGYKNKSAAWAVQEYGRIARYIKPLEEGHVGFAWAARREVFDKVGFYDRNIIYNSDTLMADAFYGLPYSVYVNVSSKSLEDYNLWLTKISKDVSKSVFYTKGTILHLWHGLISGRRFKGRNPVVSWKFDPQKDIKKNAQGIWEWSCPEKQGLQNDLINYFKCTTLWRVFLWILRERALVLAGRIGVFIKKINTPLYNWLIAHKPNFLK